MSRRKDPSLGDVAPPFVEWKEKEFRTLEKVLRNLLKTNAPFRLNFLSHLRQDQSEEELIGEVVEIARTLQRLQIKEGWTGLQTPLDVLEYLLERRWWEKKLKPL